jgi:hypothetical protein
MGPPLGNVYEAVATLYASQQVRESIAVIDSHCFHSQTTELQLVIKTLMQFHMQIFLSGGCSLRHQLRLIEVNS